MSEQDRTFDTGDHSSDKVDSKLPISFQKKRHTEPISGPDTEFQTWRMKERMKTVSVALVLCLNVGVDPPDIVKTQPCARLECWIDPQSMSGPKALETIGASLQKQYERWQPRARYKQSLDPTAEEVKKLCTSLRRNAKEERVLFHYNGHGVPKPTANGEIWVFNRNYTQYIPLSVFDLQSWMGAPSIYVYDCSNAGMIVESFKNFAEQHEKEYEQMISLAKTTGNIVNPVPHCFKNCIQLAACSSTQILPMNPDLPADLFTSCLTTPIKIALTWYMMQSSAVLIPKVTMEHIEKIPGQLNDRRTMLGELNWIFTAITDTIAWNTLPKDLFQKLFRQDLLVASLFRNFLLAERVMRSFDCTPVSSPKLPSTHQHAMWLAWDWAVDGCLLQLPGILEGDQTFKHSSFFEEQLTAFEVWLLLGSENRKPPEQLPVVLQVLLSQVHRLRALELLGRFLDLGPWAVNLALSVGIFPYVLKLLQSSARELRPLLVFIWAKILAVDSTCQADLVRDNGHKYFLSVLQDTSMSSEDRTLAAFVLATIVHQYPQGQEVALQGSLVSICLVQLADPNPLLRQWLAICLGRLWTGYDKARWCGVRDMAHEKLYHLLDDQCPEVRAAGVYALGTFISSVVERSEHANNIDQSVAMNLLNKSARDMSALVRKELVAALQWMVLLFETSFLSVALQEEGRVRDGGNMVLVSIPTEVLLSPGMGLRRIASRDRLKLAPGMMNADGPSAGNADSDRIKRVSSSSSISSTGPGGVTALPNIAYGSVYMKLWSGLTSLDSDPHPGVAALARTVTDYIRDQIKDCAAPKEINESLTRISSVSLPPSPSSRPAFLSGESPPTSGSTTDLHRLASRSTHSISRSRKNVPITISEETDDSVGHRKPLVSTNFVEWSSKFFTKPVNRVLKNDSEGAEIDYERNWRFSRNGVMRAEAQEERKRLQHSRLESQMFTIRAPFTPTLLLMYPYQPLLAIATADTVSLYDYMSNSRTAHVTNNTSTPKQRATKVTSIDLINPHDNALLMVGADDGTLRLWSHHGVGLSCGSGSGFGLVTAWQALADAPPTTKVLNSKAGLVASWEQRHETIAVSGDVRVIRIWDATSEMKVQDINTNSDCCVTSLSCDGQLLAASCGDGTVRVFDRRTSRSDVKVYTWREHTGWIVNCSLKGDIVTSGSVTGDVRFFDLRRGSSVANCQTTQGMTAMAVHREADIFACGSVNQLIGVYNHKGSLLSTIKYHEGFMGTRIAAVSCLAFHPQRPLLAAGSVDASISIYSVDPKR